MICMVEKSDCSAVEECRRIVNELIRMESRGNGDTENAMKRLAHRHGLSWRVFWKLRYRTPTDVFVSVYQQLQAAHRAECGRALDRIRHELDVARATGVPVDDLADQVANLAAQLADCLANDRQV